LLLQPEILALVPPARPRPGDRAGADAIPLDAHQHFGGRPRQAHLPEVQVVHVGRRIDAPQRPVDGERSGAGASLETLRQDHLEDVPGADVVLGPADILLVTGLADIGRPAAAAAGPAGRQPYGSRQQALGGLDAAAGGAVALLEGAAAEAPPFLLGAD